MIITGLCIAIVLLGFILIKSNKSEDTDMAGAIMSGFGIFFLMVSLVIIIASHATANHVVQANKINYEGLCKRYEIVKSEYEDVSKSDVIGDITAWNMEVYKTKYWSENPWTNWFNPKEIADNLEYIPLEESEDLDE